MKMVIIKRPYACKRWSAGSDADRTRACRSATTPSPSRALTTQPGAIDRPNAAGSDRGRSPLSCSGCQAKPMLENARAHQNHQDLIDGDARALVHGVQAVQQTYDLLRIEERKRGESTSAERVLHEGIQF